MWVNNFFDFDNYKVPLIAGSTGFILILFINIIIGNSFFVVFTRSLFYGAVVFSVFFGILILYRKFVITDFDNKLDDEDKDKKNSKVDITLGDEDFKTNFNDKTTLKFDEAMDISDEELLKNDIVTNEKKEQNDNINIDNKSDAKIPVNKNGKEKNTLKDLELYEQFGDEEEDVESIKENLSEPDNKENTSSDNEISNLDENNYDIEDVAFDNDEGISKKYEKEIDIEKAIKSKIGTNVSYDDVVKAIRTKLKED